LRRLTKRLAKLGAVAALGVFLAGLAYLSTNGNTVAEVSEGALFALGWGVCVWEVEQL
jgi:hypothetical protein